MKKLKLGLKYKIDKIVKLQDSAIKHESGTLEVFATPAMIALMENTSKECIKNILEEGMTTVGIALDIKHVKATPIGMKVKCESEVIDIDRNKITFKVIAYDEEGVIGEGIHKRCIINVDEFMSKINKKK